MSTMTRLVDRVAELPHGTRRQRSNGHQRKRRIVEQAVVPAGGAAAMKPVAEAPVGRPRTVQVPVTRPEDPRNPYLAEALSMVAAELDRLGESGSEGLTRQEFNGPTPTRQGISDALRAFLRARDMVEAERMLIRLASNAIAYAARRKEQRCRRYSQPVPYKRQG